MVWISKFYLTLQKNFIACIRVTIKKASVSSLGIKILTVFRNFVTRFFTKKQISQFDSCLTVVVFLPCIHQQIKGKQSDKIKHSSFISSKLHEAACSICCDNKIH